MWFRSQTDRYPSRGAKLDWIVLDEIGDLLVCILYSLAFHANHVATRSFVLICHLPNMVVYLRWIWGDRPQNSGAFLRAAASVTRSVEGALVLTKTLLGIRSECNWFMGTRYTDTSCFSIISILS